MLNFLDAIAFKQVIWLIPIILLLHEMEEWNIYAWHIKNAIPVPGETYLSTRMWLLFLSLGGFLWTALAVLLPDNILTARTIAVLIAFTLLNGIQHLLGLLRYRQYNPGLFFSNVFGIPVGIYLTNRMLTENLLSTGVVFAFGILILIGLAGTLKMIHLINRFGIRLADWVSH